MARTSPLSRRDWLRLSAAGALGAGASWLPSLAARAAADPKRKRACIVLWMSGGPSQIDTFDPKPGEATGGPLKAIDTAVPGVRVTELLPTVAGKMKHLAVVRSAERAHELNGIGGRIWRVERRVQLVEGGAQ